MSNSDIEQAGTVKGHIPNGASLSGRISNVVSLSGHISIGGGTSDFIIKMTVESNGDESYTVISCDATVEQIDAAVAAEKRVVLIATQINSSLLWEMPVVRGLKGNFYYFGTFLQGEAIAAFVVKDGYESGWLFSITQIQALDVGYSNNALPGISTVEEALGALVTKSHTHANKAVLDKFAESDGKPTYDGKVLGEGGGAGDFVIKMTVEGDGDYDYTITSCDATFEQVGAAVAAEKRVVLFVSDGYAVFELPMLQGIEGNAYYFGAFSGSQIIISFVEKIGNTSNWEFDMNQIQSEDVGYSNAALPSGTTNVRMALDELVPKSHSHANKDTLDKLSDANGKLQYNGSDVGLKPVKGTDYWTAADKAEIVNDTLAALPTWTGGNY